MVGKTISHYRILEKLGGGGMGVVYKAQDLKLDRFVALKFLPHHLSADEEEKKRFVHEAKAASALDHPNICTIYEIDETEDGQMFIAMAYYEGETLKKRIAKGEERREKGEEGAAPIALRSSPFVMAGGLSLTEVIDIAIQIAQGLAKAHEHGITHRDIKPANVMITKDGVVKIVDFGLAKLAGQTKLTKSGMTLGTVAYMSPEQARGEEVDHRTDIWALGVVLYEMITGQLPFKGEYEQAVVYSILCEEPQPMTGLRAGVPMELEQVVSKCMAKDATNRYQHIEEVLVDLRAMAESLKSARLKSKPTAETSPKRKGTFLYVGLATVLVLLIAATYFFMGRSDGKVIDSLAVLPLDNLSGDPKQEYFADGMTEALIADLAQISSLRVISRTSVMQYKSARKPLKEIARELNVAAILEGSVFQDGERVRITAQLIEAVTDRHLWAKSYERDMRDILALHSEVARAVAREIKITLTTDEEMRLATSRPVNPAAHEAFLKGQYHLQQHQMGRIGASEDPLRSSIAYFQQAIELDPGWAEAHAALAQAYHFLASSFRLQEFYPKSKAAALKALEIDESVSDAHGSLAFVLHNYDWDWVAAEREYRRALELNPNSALWAWGMAAFLHSAGQYEDAILWYKRAEERNPLFIPVKRDMGEAYICAGQYDQAIELLRNTLELAPNAAYVRSPLANAYLHKSMYEEAIAESHKALAQREGAFGYPLYLARLGHTYAVAGRRGEALEVLNQLERRKSGRISIMIGQTISHYKIIEKLGGGGMGVVYKAEDTRLKRIVALKFLPSSIMASEAEKARFVHEAQAAAALNHPNICTIYEINEIDGQAFIAMEFVEGQSLKEKIAAGPLKLDETLNIAMQAAEGLQAAHEKKITHRDIKPANIMLTTKGQVKVMDFGLAKLAGRSALTKAGMTLGTVAYMSPEQGRGEKVDHRTDIWAFGVVLYEMITGQHPFKGEYDQAVMYSIMNETPAPITGLRTGVPMALERIVNKALAKKPHERYQHFDEILVDLRALQKGFVASAPKQPLAEGKSHGKKKAYLYGGVAGLIALLIGISFYFKLQTGARQARYDSIAVLPLDNLSGDPEQEYFVDGMTEALITNLAQIGALRVISRTSVMRYKDTKKSLPEIAEELKAAALVEGSVQRFENRVRITAQLIDAAADRHLWAKSYERDLRNVLALQNEVAQAIAHEIQIKLTPQEQARLASARAVDPDAYETYLKGLYFWNKSTPANLNKAITYYEQAIAKDPNFALAYQGLASCYDILGIHYLAPNEMFPKSQFYAQKAFALDSTLAPIFVPLAVYHFFYAWDWPAAERYYRRALELNPKYEHAHYTFGDYLVVMGRTDEGIAEKKRALELDPLSLIINWNLGRAYYLARRFDQAIEQCQKTLELDPNFVRAYLHLAAAYVQKKMYNEAIAILKEAENFAGNLSPVVAELGYALAASGQRLAAQKILRELQERATQEYIDPCLIAFIYIALGEKDQAFKWLERAYEERSAQMVWLNLEPKLDPLRAEARFMALVKKVGLQK